MSCSTILIENDNKFPNFQIANFQIIRTFASIKYNIKMKNTFLDKKFRENIHPRVFWDCNFEDLDIKKDKVFIIGRVLMRGTDKEIHFIEDNFSLKEIKEAVEKSTEVDDICVNYYRKLYLYETRRK